MPPPLEPHVPAGGFQDVSGDQALQFFQGSRSREDEDPSLVGLLHAELELRALEEVVQDASGVVVSEHRDPIRPVEGGEFFQQGEVALGDELFGFGTLLSSIGRHQAGLARRSPASNAGKRRSRNRS